MRTFPIDTPELVKANPVDSLDWGEYLADLEELARSAPPGEDVGDR
jgi:DNA polymerase-4